jgi:hypothetical protein
MQEDQRRAALFQRPISSTSGMFFPVLNRDVPQARLRRDAQTSGLLGFAPLGASDRSMDRSVGIIPRHPGWLRPAE